MVRVIIPCLEAEAEGVGVPAVAKLAVEQAVADVFAGIGLVPTLCLQR